MWAPKPLCIKDDLCFIQYSSNEGQHGGAFCSTCSPQSSQAHMDHRRLARLPRDNIPQLVVVGPIHLCSPRSSGITAYCSTALLSALKISVGFQGVCQCVRLVLVTGVSVAPAQKLDGYVHFARLPQFSLNTGVYNECPRFVRQYHVDPPSFSTCLSIGHPPKFSRLTIHTRYVSRSSLR